MNRINLLICMALVVSAAGCSTIRVETDFDQDVDFSLYRTYKWIPPKMQVMPKKPYNDPLTMKHIKNAVKRELSATGYAEATTERPDFLVACHIGTRKKVDVDVYGYRYGWRGRWAARDVHVHKYREGTLILDIVDANSRELAWRGWAVGVLHGRENAEEDINNYVVSVLKKFPPGK